MLDTNIVLDLLVFRDPAAGPLQAALAQGRLRWLATAAMREELERVLGYPHLAARLAAAGLAASQVLDRFDRQACLVDAAPRAPISCTDPDDQPFIDLAVQHRCTVLSKDAAVLALKPRLLALQATAAASLPASSYSLNQG